MKLLTTGGLDACDNDLNKQTCAERAVGAPWRRNRSDPSTKNMKSHLFFYILNHKQFNKMLILVCIIK